MDFISLASVVDVLNNDSMVINERVRFAHHLDIPDAVSKQFNGPFNNGVGTSYEFFKEILSHWIGKQGQTATVGFLKEKLEHCGLQSAADTVGTLGDLGTVVVTVGSESPAKIVGKNYYGEGITNSSSGIVPHIENLCKAIATAGDIRSPRGDRVVGTYFNILSQLEAAFDSI